jgi:hypothetical protein
MKWVKRKRPYGDKRKKIKFAWFPKKFVDELGTEYWVWLEKYVSHQVYYKGSGDLDDNAPFDGWSEVKATIYKINEL